jgi:uncharacterized protein
VRLVSLEEARRIAVRAQALDGSARGVLSTIRRLGFLQIDSIATVAQPQYLVLWSRLGPYDAAQLDRLLWKERKLFEWNAFIWPMEDLPLLKARMRRWGRTGRHVAWEKRVNDFLKTNAAFKRFLLGELERNGPMLSRELEHDSPPRYAERHRWYGTRQVALMLDILYRQGVVAVVGRRNGQRLWDLAGRWYPETETVPWREAERLLEEKHWRALGVRKTRERWEAHPDVADREVSDRATLLSPFDRLVYDRDRAEALWDFRYRIEIYVPKAKREYGYYVLPLLVGDQVVGRAEPRFDRKTGTLELLGAWGDTSRLDEALDGLAEWLGVART